MKALEWLRAMRRDTHGEELEIDEAIAELVALQQHKSCEGCVREAEDMVDPHCAFCSRACNDNYEPKE